MYFEVLDLKNEKLNKLFNEWNKVVINSQKKLPQIQPFNMTENTNTGHLVAACGRLDIVAFQEYRTTQLINNKIHRGTGDLFIFFDDQNIFRIEAKQAGFPEINTKRKFDLIKRKIAENREQISKYEVAKLISFQNEKYISLIYIVPIIYPSKVINEKGLKYSWERFITEVKNTFYNDSCFLISHRYHYKDIIFEKEKGELMGYPGILILGEIL